MSTATLNSEQVEILTKTLDAVRVMMKNQDRRPNEEPIYHAVAWCLAMIESQASSA